MNRGTMMAQIEQTQGDLVKAAPAQIRFWANRFGESCDENNPYYPGDAQINQWVERYYPNEGNCVELAHIVTLDGAPGILLEWEFSGPDGEKYKPSPAVAAHWRMTQPEGVRYLVYDGEFTFDGRWVFAVFLPFELLDGHENPRALIDSCGDSMIKWGARA